MQPYKALIVVNFEHLHMCSDAIANACEWFSVMPEGFLTLTNKQYQLPTISLKKSRILLTEKFFIIIFFWWNKICSQQIEVWRFSIFVSSQTYNNSLRQCKRSCAMLRNIAYLCIKSLHQTTFFSPAEKIKNNLNLVAISTSANKHSQLSACSLKE